MYYVLLDGGLANGRPRIPPRLSPLLSQTIFFGCFDWRPLLEGAKVLVAGVAALMVRFRVEGRGRPR